MVDVFFYIIGLWLKGSRVQGFKGSKVQAFKGLRIFLGIFGHVWARKGMKRHEMARMGTNGNEWARLGTNGHVWVWFGQLSTGRLRRGYGGIREGLRVIS